MPSMGEVIHDSAYFWNAKENSHIIESNIWLLKHIGGGGINTMNTIEGIHINLQLKI